jgi:hypothetical protein
LFENGYFPEAHQRTACSICDAGPKYVAATVSVNDSIGRSDECSAVGEKMLECGFGVSELLISATIAS